MRIQSNLISSNLIRDFVLLDIACDDDSSLLSTIYSRPSHHFTLTTVFGNHKIVTRLLHKDQFLNVCFWRFGSVSIKR